MIAFTVRAKQEHYTIIVYITLSTTIIRTQTQTFLLPLNKDILFSIAGLAWLDINGLIGMDCRL